MEKDNLQNSEVENPDDFTEDLGMNSGESAQTEGEGDEELGTSEDEQSGKTRATSEDIQKVINRKHYQYHEEKRKREALEKENQELKAKLAPAAPEIPPLPDTYDPEYVQKIAARDEAITKRAQWDTQQKTAQSMPVTSTQPNAQESIQAKEKVFIERMTGFGITQKESNEQQNTILPFLTPQLATFILEAEDGPLITKYLANNAVDLVKISEMDPVKAGAYIARYVSPKAAKLAKARTTNAPDPVEPVGRGANSASQRTSEFMKGVILE